jgi:glucose-6-phosphate 1-dehydrogenase
VTPLLHEIDGGEVPIFPYPYGSRGPPEADDLLVRTGFVKNLEYVWSKSLQMSPAALATSS